MTIQPDARGQDGHGRSRARVDFTERVQSTSDPLDLHAWVRLYVSSIVEADRSSQNPPVT